MTVAYTSTLAPGVFVEDISGRIVVRWLDGDEMRCVDITLPVSEIARNIYLVAQRTGMAPEDEHLSPIAVH